MVRFDDGIIAIYLPNPAPPLKEKTSFNQTKTITATGKTFVYTRYTERTLEITWDYLKKEDYQKLKDWFERQEGQGKVWKFYPDANDLSVYYTVRFWQESLEFEEFIPGGYKGTITLRVER